MIRPFARPLAAAALAVDKNNEAILMAALEDAMKNPHLSLSLGHQQA